MKIRQENHLYLHNSDTFFKTKEDCIDEAYYICISWKIIKNNFEGWNCTEKCLPKAMMSKNSNKTFICKNEEQESCAVQVENWVNVTTKTAKYKCPRPCSITKYSGKLDFWEPNAIEKSFTFNLRFAPPVNATVFEEYLIYNFVGMIGTIGGTLGLFMGFSCCCILNLITNIFKKQTYQTFKEGIIKICKHENSPAHCVRTEH